MSSGRRRLDLRRLPAVARYALALAIVAVVVALALRSTDASDSPGWYERLGPFLGVLAIVIVLVAIAQRRRR